MNLFDQYPFLQNDYIMIHKMDPADAAALLTDYLIGEVGLKTVTAHILRTNEGSAACVLKNGYVQKFSNIYEDWGFGEPCLTDKYVYKRDFRKKRVK